MKSAPSCDERGLLNHEVAESLEGAGIMGLYSSAPGKASRAQPNFDFDH